MKKKRKTKLVGKKGKKFAQDQERVDEKLIKKNLFFGWEDSSGKSFSGRKESFAPSFD